MKKMMCLGMMAALVLCGTLVAADAIGSGSEQAARTLAEGMLKNGAIIRSEVKKKHDGRTVYNYVVVSATDQAEVEVDAETGELVKFEREPLQSATVPDNSRRTVTGDSGVLSIENIRKIALDKVGGGEIVELEKKLKRSGRVEYEVEVLHDNSKHEMEIDGRTGRILEYKFKRW